MHAPDLQMARDHRNLSSTGRVIDPFALQARHRACLRTYFPSLDWCLRSRHHRIRGGAEWIAGGWAALPRPGGPAPWLTFDGSSAASFHNTGALDGTDWPGSAAPGIRGRALHTSSLRRRCARLIVAGIAVTQPAGRTSPALSALAFAPRYDGQIRFFSLNLTNCGARRAN